MWLGEGGLGGCEQLRPRDLPWGLGEMAVGSEHGQAGDQRYRMDVFPKRRPLNAPDVAFVWTLLHSDSCQTRGAVPCQAAAHRAGSTGTPQPLPYCFRENILHPKPFDEEREEALNEIC